MHRMLIIIMENLILEKNISQSAHQHKTTQQWEYQIWQKGRDPLSFSQLVLVKQDHHMLTSYLFQWLWLPVMQ